MRFLLRNILASIALTVAFASQGLADDPYEFVKNFELKSARIRGAIATFVLEHSVTDKPRFEFIASPICAESWPLQCGGTLVRLDDPGSIPQDGEPKQRTRLRVNFERIYGATNKAYVTVIAPNRQKTLLFVGSQAPNN